MEKLTVGKLKENSLESVMMRIGGATKFLTDFIMTNGIKQITDRTTATYSSGPATKKEKLSLCSINIDMNYMATKTSTH